MHEWHLNALSLIERLLELPVSTGAVTPAILTSLLSDEAVFAGFLSLVCQWEQPQITNEDEIGTGPSPDHREALLERRAVLASGVLSRLVLHESVSVALSQALTQLAEEMKGAAGTTTVSDAALVSVMDGADSTDGAALTASADLGCVSLSDDEHMRLSSCARTLADLFLPRSHTAHKHARSFNSDDELFSDSSDASAAQTGALSPQARAFWMMDARKGKVLSGAVLALLRAVCSYVRSVLQTHNDSRLRLDLEPILSQLQRCLDMGNASEAVSLRLPLSVDGTSRLLHCCCVLCAAAVCGGCQLEASVVLQTLSG